jgi:hypothetical protein
MVFSMEAKSIEDVPVVREYPDVFPEELPEMPPDRDIEFAIDLIPGTSPIAERPYRMAAPERTSAEWVYQAELITMGSPSALRRKEG